MVTTFLAYVGLFVMHDPFLSNQGRVVPEEIQTALRAKFGMDKPVPVRYLIYLGNMFTGDLGIDFERRRPVFDLIAAALPNTARLALIAIAAQILIGVTVGVVGALFHHSLLDTLITTSTILLFAIPVFVLATVLRSELSGLHVFGVEVFPIVPTRFTIEVPWYKEILLPAISLAVGEIAIVARLARASMLDVLTADYLRTARSKGLAESRVVVRHGVPNALIPVVNLAGVGLGVLLGGAFMVEAIFEYRGLGHLLFRAMSDQNDPVILAVAVYATITFIVLSAAVDVLCAYLDPRIRVH